MFQAKAMTTFSTASISGQFEDAKICSPVRSAVEFRQAGCYASCGACGRGSASPTRSLVTTSSGRQPGTRGHQKLVKFMDYIV